MFEYCARLDERLVEKCQPVAGVTKLSNFRLAQVIFGLALGLKSFQFHLSAETGLGALFSISYFVVIVLYLIWECEKLEAKFSQTSRPGYVQSMNTWSAFLPYGLIRVALVGATLFLFVLNVLATVTGMEPETLLARTLNDLSNVILGGGLFIMAGKPRTKQLRPVAISSKKKQ